MKDADEVGEDEVGLGDAPLPVVVAAVLVEPGVGVVDPAFVEGGEGGVALVGGPHVGQRQPLVAHGQPEVGGVGLLVHGLEVEGQALAGVLAGPQVAAAGVGDELRRVAAAAGHVPGVAPQGAAEDGRPLLRGHVAHELRVAPVAGLDLGEALLRQGLGVEEGGGELQPLAAAEERGLGVLGVDGHGHAGLLQHRVGVVAALGRGHGHDQVGLQFQHHLEVDPRAVADLGDGAVGEALVHPGGVDHPDVADRRPGSPGGPAARGAAAASWTAPRSGARAP